MQTESDQADKQANETSEPSSTPDPHADQSSSSKPVLAAAAPERPSGTVSGAPAQKQSPRKKITLSSNRLKKGDRKIIKSFNRFDVLSDDESMEAEDLDDSPSRTPTNPRSPIKFPK